MQTVIRVRVRASALDISFLVQQSLNTLFMRAVCLTQQRSVFFKIYTYSKKSYLEAHARRTRNDANERVSGGGVTQILFS